MSLCFAQREEGTDEEDEDAPGDYIGDRLAHARLEATGQLYREVRSVDWERGAFLFAASTFQQQYVLSLSLLDTRGIIQGCVGLTARILGPALPFLLRSRKACRDSKSHHRLFGTCAGTS